MAFSCYRYLPIRNFGKYSRKCYVEILIILKVVPLFLPYCFLTFQALGERYKVDEKNFPAIFLFKGNAEEYIQLPSHKDVTVNNLRPLSIATHIIISVAMAVSRSSMRPSRTTPISPMKSN